MSIYHGVNPRKAQCLNSVLNVKALEGAFNQEKALVGAFSVRTSCGTEGAYTTQHSTLTHSTDVWCAMVRPRCRSPPCQPAFSSTPTHDTRGRGQEMLRQCGGVDGRLKVLILSTRNKIFLFHVVKVPVNLYSVNKHLIWQMARQVLVRVRRDS